MLTRSLLQWQDHLGLHRRLRRQFQVRRLSYALLLLAASFLSVYGTRMLALESSNGG